MDLIKEQDILNIEEDAEDEEDLMDGDEADADDDEDKMEED